LLNIFGFGLMITLVRTLYKENGDMFPDNVKGFCFMLITLGLFVRAWFFTIDPYSLRGIMSAFFNRILYNIFYPIVLMAYCVMLLQWYGFTGTIFNKQNSNPIQLKQTGLKCVNPCRILLGCDT
jgi:hypothetical protein